MPCVKILLTHKGVSELLIAAVHLQSLAQERLEGGDGRLTVAGNGSVASDTVGTSLAMLDKELRLTKCDGKQPKIETSDGITCHCRDVGRGVGYTLAVSVGDGCEHNARERARLEQKREMSGGPRLSVRGSRRVGWASAGSRERGMGQTAAK